MISYFILHIGFCLMLFIVMFMYASSITFEETKLEKDWDIIKVKFKNRLKQNYLLKNQSDVILVRLKFLDSRFLRNSILVEPVVNKSKTTILKLSARTDLKPLGFIVFLMLTFVFYVGVIYMFLLIKKARQREMKEMQFIANLSSNF